MQGNLNLKVNVLNKIKGYAITILDPVGGVPSGTVFKLEGLKAE